MGERARKNNCVCESVTRECEAAMEAALRAPGARRPERSADGAARITPLLHVLAPIFLHDLHTSDFQSIKPNNLQKRYPRFSTDAGKITFREDLGRRFLEDRRLIMIFSPQETRNRCNRETARLLCLCYMYRRLPIPLLLPLRSGESV